MCPRFFNSHKTVNHSKQFKDPVTGVHSNTIEGNWSAIKRQTPVRCRTRSLVPLYLVRFMLNRNSPDNTLEELIKFLLYVHLAEYNALNGRIMLHFLLISLLCHHYLFI